jgi:hypothetical protein
VALFDNYPSGRGDTLAGARRHDYDPSNYIFVRAGRVYCRHYPWGRKKRATASLDCRRAARIRRHASVDHWNADTLSRAQALISEGESGFSGVG